jgi:hypothetical protein
VAVTEYRANYAHKWIHLLLARGFDPAKVEREFEDKLWQVVD